MEDPGARTPADALDERVTYGDHLQRALDRVEEFARAFAKPTLHRVNAVTGETIGWAERMGDGTLIPFELHEPMDALVAARQAAKDLDGKLNSVLMERQERTAELVGKLYEVADGNVRECFAHAAAMCEEQERRTEDAEARTAELEEKLASISLDWMIEDRSSSSLVVADELIRNVTDGEFGKVFKSVKYVNTKDETDGPAEYLVIAAVGSSAATLDAAYDRMIEERE